MKVLYVDHTQRVSGAERSLAELLHGLPDHVDAVLACPRGPFVDVVGTAAVEHVPLVATAGSLRLHPVHTTRSLGELLVMAWQIRSAARHGSVDIVHANTLQAGLAAGLARRLGGPPLVVHIRDCLPAGRAARAVRRWIAETADALIAISQFTAECFGPETSDVVPNAVDLQRFDCDTADGNRVRTELGLPAEAPVLAVIAQITPWKGQDDAIGVLTSLRADHPNAQLLVVGEPKFTFAATRYDNVAYMHRLRRLVAEQGVENAVHFLGERDDIPDVLAASDVVLVPSWEEPFGRTVIEAMAMGVPTIATSIGGPREILDDGVHGVLLPPREPELWANAARELLEDAAARTAMGKRARAKARQLYGRDAHAERVLEIYRRLL